MFSTFHYVPVLKWKQGEYLALASLSETVRQAITPVIEIVEPDTKPLDKHLETSIDNVERAWGKDRPFFLDMYYVGDMALEDSSVIAASKAYELASDKGLTFIPVVSPSYSQDEIQAITDHMDHGLCIRLVDDDINDDLLRELGAFLQRLSVSHQDVDLIYDLTFIEMTTSQAYRLAVPVLQDLAAVGEWRTLTICGTSFPESMKGYKTGEVSAAERKEWALWKRLLTNDNLSRLPSFGDYAIQHPDPIDFDPAIMQSSATIRYALEDEWLFVRGYGLKARGRGGYKQYKGLSAQLREMEQYYGKDHCHGCTRIDEIADRDEKHGNQSTWRQIGTCHHITVTAEAIDRLSDASGTGEHAV